MSQMLNNPGCGATPTPEACDIPYPLEWALDAMKHLKDALGVMSFAEIQQEIDSARRPVAICIVFNGPLGPTNHYCLIKGCDVISGTSHVTVLDPSPINAPESHIPLEDLSSGIALGGAWTQSFTVT